MGLVLLHGTMSDSEPSKKSVIRRIERKKKYAEGIGKEKDSLIDKLLGSF
jgi:hypothetical protein